MSKKEQNAPDGTNPNGQKDPKKPRFRWLSWLMYTLAFFLIAVFLFGDGDSGSQKGLSYTKLAQYIENDAVKELTVYDDNHVEATIRPVSYVLVFGEQAKGEQANGKLRAQIPSVDEFAKYIDGVNTTRKETGKQLIDVTYKQSKNYWYIFLVNALPLLLLVIFFVWMSRGVSGMSAGGGIFSVGKAKAQVFDKEKKDKVTFKDVAGLTGAKQEVQEIVAFLKNPKKYTDLGGKIPKGALLVGPPGTGKTLLAKAVAGEADVPFFSMSGSDFVEMFVGVGASRVRDLFRQLLVEMDGFGVNEGVIVIAATNRADVLDPALLRAGRFDRQIHVELPDLQERKEIFEVHLRPIKTDNTVDVDFLAKQTPGFSGADIANVCNEAALIAARNNHKKVGKQDFMDAVDRIVGGLERKTKILTDEEKRSIAYHEAGHATISWMLRWANPLVKVTIVPRGAALGAAWYLPEERQLTNEEHILDELCSLLGGRAAEQLFLHQTSTGALNDLERATKQAYAMVAYYGMSDKLKDVSFYDSTGRYDYGFAKPYSDKTAELIDKETAAIIAEQMARARKILEENVEGHHQIAQMLIEKEVITSEDVEHILGPRPWKSRGDEIIEANEKQEQQEQETAAKENNADTENKTDNDNTDNTIPNTTDNEETNA